MLATRLLWEAAGRPDPRKSTMHASGRCYWCGDDAGGLACRTNDVCGPSFTDHDAAQAPASPIMCCACTWVMTGRPPDTLRLWSLIYREDGYRFVSSHPSAPTLGPRIHLHNKAEPSEFDRLLRDPPHGRWVCAIADSGKLHVVPFARVNYGPGAWCVRFERYDVRSHPAEYARLADLVQELYDAGYSKDDIRSGQPSPSRLMRLGIDRWRTADTVLGRYRGGPLLGLVLFLRRKAA